jgi:nitrite reductase (NADH) small subunit
METVTDIEITWKKACLTTDIPQDGGACVLIEGEQIAIYNFSRRGEWFSAHTNSKWHSHEV